MTFAGEKVNSFTLVFALQFGCVYFTLVLQCDLHVCLRVAFLSNPVLELRVVFVLCEKLLPILFGSWLGSLV